MKKCDCQDPHARRRIVLTGGPGAGKTAVLDPLRIESPAESSAGVGVASPGGI